MLSLIILHVDAVLSFLVEEFIDNAQGVMGCSECKHKLQVRISADDVSFFFNSLMLFSLNC